jgi:hypothetical protein
VFIHGDRSGGRALFTLAHLSAFAGETCFTLTGSLTINGDGNTTHVNDLQGLVAVRGNLIVVDSEALTNLDGLANLRYVGGTLLVQNDQQLTSVDGLGALEFVRNDAAFHEADALPSLRGAGGLERVGRKLQLTNNNILTNRGLVSLTDVGGTFVVTGNPNLPANRIIALADFLGVPAASRTISGNGTNACAFCDDEDGPPPGCSDHVFLHGPRTLFTLTHLAAFAANTCFTLTGSLTLNGDGNVTHVESLAGLVAVRGDLTLVDSEALTNLDGLRSLTYVGGNMLVRHNEDLTSVDGLGDLTMVRGSLTMQDNDDLPSQGGISSLVDVGVSLLVDGNADLTNVGVPALARAGGTVTITNNPLVPANLAKDLADGTQVFGATPLVSGNGANGCFGCPRTDPPAPACTGHTFLHGDRVVNTQTQANGFATFTCATVTGALTIDGDGGLVNVNGLAGLRGVRGRLTVQISPALADMSGLDKVTQVGGALTVDDDDQLPDLSGLEAVSRVRGNLVIRNNGKLTSVTTMTALTHVGGGLTITNNPQLPTSDANALVTQVSPLDQPPAVVSGNGP